MSTEHPRHKLVDEFTNPVRFSLVAGLAGVEQIDFATLRNHLQVSDSVLSRQASQLEGLGIVAVRKGYIGKRPAPGSASPRRAASCGSPTWLHCGPSPRTPSSLPRGTVPERPGPISRGDSGRRADWVA